MAFGDETGPNIKVCCGPRCGQETGHRAIYAAVEAAASLPVRPVGCQGYCRGGVTVVLPDRPVQKIQNTSDVGKTLTELVLSGNTAS